jgi:hypothetical protein
MKKIVTVALLCTLLGTAPHTVEARGGWGWGGFGLGLGLGLGAGYPYRYGYGYGYPYSYGWGYPAYGYYGGGYPRYYRSYYPAYQSSYYYDDYYYPRRSPQYSAPYTQFTTVTNSTGQDITIEFEHEGRLIDRIMRPNDRIQIKGRIVNVRSDNDVAISVSSHRSDVEIFLDSKGQLQMQ